MPNPSNKQELLAAMADSYAKLNEQIAKMSEEAISAPFDFAADPKKCGVRRPLSARLADPPSRMAGVDARVCEQHP